MHFNDKLELADGIAGLYAQGSDRDDTAAVIVLPEIFGVNPNIRLTVDHFAEQGFRAVALDLYWRQQAGIELDPDDGESHAKAMQCAQIYGKQLDAAMADIEALLARMRKRHRKVAVLGYCLGGRMSYLAWLRLHADAVVSYYGVGLDQFTGEIAGQNTPLLMHMGEADHLNPPEVRGRIAAALDGRPGVQIRSYPGVGHAFARRGGKSYVPDAAKAADALTLEFLREHLA